MSKRKGWRGPKKTTFARAGLVPTVRDLERTRWAAKWKGMAERRGGKVEKIVEGFRDTVPGGRRGLVRRLHRRKVR